VHSGGEFYISVTLGAQAAEIAENAQIGMVLRVSVLGDERAGPEHHAAVLAGKPDRGQGKKTDKKGNSAAPETAEVRAGQDGPALRPLPGRSPWW
jgi:Ca-activated chloride channel family protein